MTLKRAVIFDMDGVIVDSEPRHEKAFLEILQQLGYGQTHGLCFADYIGRSDRDLWVDFIAKHNPPYALEELLEMKCQRVREIIRHEKPLFDGLLALIERLAASYVLALASGSDRLLIEEVLSLGNLRQFFAVAVSASEVERGKPAPDIFLHVAKAIGVAPRECWVIEDSKPGVEAALAAGMRVIAITNTHAATELGHATHVVSSYDEIARMLLPVKRGQWC